MLVACYNWWFLILSFWQYRETNPKKFWLAVLLPIVVITPWYHERKYWPYLIRFFISIITAILLMALTWQLTPRG